MEHPFGGSWGYQVTSPTPRPHAWVPGRLPLPRRFAARGRHRGVRGLGSRTLSQGRLRTGAFRWHRALRTPGPRRGEHPDWGTFVFDFGRREVRNFLAANAVYWCEEFHVDGLRVDAVASMLYLDYSRRDGEWTPNIYGGREYLEAVDFLQEMNATVYKRVPGVVTIAEESTSWPGSPAPPTWAVSASASKWNMGWMHDSLGYVAHEPVCSGSTTTTNSPSPWCTHGARTSCCRCRTTKSCTAKVPCSGRCPVIVGSNWRRSGPTSRTCGPTRASNSFSWAASSPRNRMERRPRTGLVAAAGPC